MLVKIPTKKSLFAPRRITVGSGQMGTEDGPNRPRVSESRGWRHVFKVSALATFDVVSFCNVRHRRPNASRMSLDATTCFADC
jgi:hypothetical protein